MNRQTILIVNKSQPEGTLTLALFGNFLSQIGHLACYMGAKRPGHRRISHLLNFSLNFDEIEVFAHDQEERLKRAKPI